MSRIAPGTLLSAIAVINVYDIEGAALDYVLEAGDIVMYLCKDGNFPTEMDRPLPALDKTSYTRHVYLGPHGIFWTWRGPGGIGNWERLDA